MSDSDDKMRTEVRSTVLRWFDAVGAVLVLGGFGVFVLPVVVYCVTVAYRSALQVTP